VDVFFETRCMFLLMLSRDSVVQHDPVSRFCADFVNHNNKRKYTDIL